MVARDVLSSHPSGLAGQVHQGIGRLGCSTMQDGLERNHAAGPLVLTALGRTMNTDCLVGPPQCEPLLGQVVLERLDLIVDPTKGQLTVRPESPFLPSLKAK